MSSLCGEPVIPAPIQKGHLKLVLPASEQIGQVFCSAKLCLRGTRGTIMFPFASFALSINCYLGAPGANQCPREQMHGDWPAALVAGI